MLSLRKYIRKQSIDVSETRVRRMFNGASFKFPRATARPSGQFRA